VTSTISLSRSPARTSIRSPVMYAQQKVASSTSLSALSTTCAFSAGTAWYSA